MIDKSVPLYSRFLFNKNTTSVDKPNRKQISELVLRSCLERFKVILKNGDIRQDIVDSILYKIGINDLLTSEKKTVILDRYLSTPESEQILSTYKGVSNMMSKVRKSDGTTYSAS